MIFKRFFKPKWQHKDATVRQAAINELNAETPPHKTILHELAFNDGSEAVRRVALTKLNDFSLWWQASKHDNSERLQLLSEQRLIEMLLQNKVDTKLKQTFILQCNRSSILEQLAIAETDPKIKFNLLQRLNKLELYTQALQDSVLTTDQKQQLLTLINDEKTLERLVKRLTGELQQAVIAKLDQLEQKKQLPIKLRKQLTLFLAKLNASRERYAIAELPTKLDQYQQEWQSLSVDINCLGAEAEEYTLKYNKLLHQTQQWLAPKLAELAKQQEAQAEADAKAATLASLTQRLTSLEQELEQALVATDVNAAQKLEQKIATLLSELTTANAPSALLKKATKLQQQLTNLPLLAEQLSQLTQIVADWAVLPVVEETSAIMALEPKIQQWQQQWRQISKQMAIAVPQSLAEAKTELQQKWRKLHQEAKAETDKVVRQCRSKLAQFKRLYQAGKFNVLFGLSKGIEQDYQQLTAQQQALLTKDIEYAREKIAELGDWQEYIATPRKQALLAEVQQLPEQVTDKDIHQRAEQVKQARATWNSLGKAAAELEPELNSAFDLACEKAFSPCRSYFANLEQQRAEHLAQRQAIIKQAEQLEIEALDIKQLEQQFNQLRKAWQQAGVVDKANYQPLYQQYQAATQPIRQKIKALQQQVSEQKQQLIEQVKNALSLEQPQVTASILKESQQQWKTLGSAARKQDQALWQEFRQLCDGFFTARAEQYQQQQLVDQADKAAIEIKVAQLSVQLATAQSISAIEEVITLLHQVDNQQAVKSLLETAKLKQQQIEQRQQKAEFNAMFDLLSSSELVASDLPAPYSDSFNKQQEQQFSREELTLALEILADKPSPEEFKSQRQQVQLVLLSDKHNQGKSVGVEELLHRWLQFGQVKDNEQTLLTRIKAVFA
ncbi:DUF349 domain-containing protein [Rheinheimera sp. WS51]|uniref:DUF349 domain-containing protein n=1 Tax=Rheinheimera sp. WS51 TaxID=3425886 RepID=UPI003D89CB1B